MNTQHEPLDSIGGTTDTLLNETSFSFPLVMPPIAPFF